MLTTLTTPDQDMRDRGLSLSWGVKSRKEGTRAAPSGELRLSRLMESFSGLTGLGSGSSLSRLRIGSASGELINGSILG